MDQEANQPHVFANLSLAEMGPNDQSQPLGVSTEEGLAVTSDSVSSGESSAMDDDGSINSLGSTSSSDLLEDVSSSPPTMSPHKNNGPLYELSELFAHLPIKRGLSKFYQGKSQSYTSLASVKSLEDLAKKGPLPNRLRMKSCKSYAGIDGNKYCFSPKATISKRPSSRASFLSSNLGRRSGSFVGTLGLPCPATK